MNKKFLVTGAAGFIGFHFVQFLLSKNKKVIGVDNINNYYDTKIKKGRLKLLKNKNFIFKKINIQNKNRLETVFKSFKPNYVINLAAQAGVRYSITNPQVYIDNNIIGFQNILDLSKKYKVKLLLFASSSSVYGKNKDNSLSEKSDTSHPISIYGVTKKTNEMMAYTYSHLYNLPTIGFRLFTVFGPWGRPDMSLFKFVKNILLKKPIYLYNYGNHERNFTYIDDVSEVLFRAIIKYSNKNEIKKFKKKAVPPYKIFNISGNKSVTLVNYVNTISKLLNKKPKIKFKPLQPGDVIGTKSNINSIKNILKYKPKVSLDKGISSFIKWYKGYYN